MANDALERVRKGLRKELKPSQSRTLKGDRKILLKRAHEVSDRERLIMETWTGAFPQLLAAYEHKERFPFPTNPAMLGLLTEGMRDGGDGPCLELTVLDDIEDEDGDPHIGTARVPLAPLCEGDEIHARLSLISSSDAMVGTLRVVVRWRDRKSVV